MSERLILITGGLVSLILVIALVVPAPPQDEQSTSRPTSEDRGAAGLAGAKAWLEARGVATASLRVRYNGLSDATARPDGNVLIISLPRLRAARPDENRSLRRWINSGNTAVILAATGGSPEWTGRREESVTKALGDLDLAIDTGDHIDAGNSDGEPTIGRRVDHSLTRGANRLGVPTGDVVALEPTDKAPPWLGLHGPSDTGLVWWRRQGKGAVLLSSVPDIFGNDPLVRNGNAQFLANIVDLTLSDDGTVVFDDFHMGISQLYDEADFYSDSRLHATLWFIVAFWLLYVVGRSNRVAPPTEDERQPSSVEFVDGAAGLLARRANTNAVGRRLMAHFFDDVRRHQGLPENGQQAWDALLQLLPQQHHHIERLQRLNRRLEAGRRVSLLRLTREIEALQENLP